MSDIEGDLRVYHIRNVPNKPRYHDVATPAAGRKLINDLAAVDLAMPESLVSSNAFGLLVYEDGEWCEWHDAEGDDIDNSRMIRG